MKNIVLKKNIDGIYFTSEIEAVNTYANELKNQNVDEIKELCEVMYQDGEISFAGNGRYFILTEGAEKKKETKAKPEKESTDPTEEVRKYAKLKDDGIITEEEFQTKKMKLLGL